MRDVSDKCLPCVQPATLEKLQTDRAWQAAQGNPGVERCWRATQGTAEHLGNAGDTVVPDEEGQGGVFIFTQAADLKLYDLQNTRNTENTKFQE